MSDNFYFGCPAKSGPGFREMTNYAPNTSLNEYIAAKNQLERDDEYRLFLQQNGGQIGTNEWSYLKSHHSCFPNECIFDNKRTVVHPSTFNEEMMKYNSMPYVDSKKYFSDMTKKFNDRIKTGIYQPMYVDKEVQTFREPYTCKRFADYSAI